MLTAVSVMIVVLLFCEGPLRSSSAADVVVVVAVVSGGGVTDFFLGVL